MKVVIRVGGSVVASPPNSRLLSQHVDLLKKLKGQGHEVVAVVGGGTLARDFIGVAGQMGLTEKEHLSMAELLVILAETKRC